MAGEADEETQGRALRELGRALVNLVEVLVDPDPEGWERPSGAAADYRSRTHKGLHLCLGPVYDSDSEEAWGWWWRIDLGTAALAGRDVHDPGCSTKMRRQLMKSLIATADALHEKLIVELPGWTPVMRSSPDLCHVRSSEGLQLFFHASPNSARFLGWEWRWAVVEGSSKRTLASGVHLNQRHLDFQEIIAVVEEAATKIDGALGGYR